MSEKRYIWIICWIYFECVHGITNRRRVNEKEEGIYEKPTTVMVLNAVLFGVWHLGYIISPLMNGEWMALSKLVIGFAFGMILGFVRMKTKNCYSTFLVHGLLNSFL